MDIFTSRFEIIAFGIRCYYMHTQRLIYCVVHIYPYY